MSRIASILLLYAGYATTTTGGLLLVKYWLASARLAWRSGDLLALPSLAVAAGAGLYALSFVIWILIVERLPLSIAFPTAVGVAMVAITLGSALLLRETIGSGQLLGMVLILVGIALTARTTGGN